MPYASHVRPSTKKHPIQLTPLLRLRVSTVHCDHMSIKKTGAVEGVGAGSSLSCRILFAWVCKALKALRSKYKSVVHQVRKMEKEVRIGGADTRLKPLRRRRGFGTHTNVVTCICTTLILGRWLLWPIKGANGFLFHDACMKRQA
ncbi:hypothetical protein VNO77_03340 [Canavalia gladiata]|uniref:Uncharacterized protein n=1 Tax=Canavalia gladiata TaxID=3824 RepID=A0AAN9MUK2_CANGL